MSGVPAILTQPKTGRTERAKFLPGIVTWLKDESPAKLFEKSRRIGATYAEAYDATRRRFGTQPREQDYWFSSADESSAAEFIEYCAFFARDLFGKIVDLFLEQYEDSDTKRVGTAHCIRCPNGKRITAMTSNPRRFRSKGGDVCLDEYSFHDEPRAMYTAAEPCTRWGGWLRVLSTHNGEDSEYSRMVKRCHRVLQALGYDPTAPSETGSRPWGQVPGEELVGFAREQRLTPIFSFHRMTIEDAVNQGLVELINRVKGTAFTREAFVQDCRDSSIDDDAYLEEYMCTPAQGDKVWLAYATIERCEDEACPQPGEPLAGYTGGPAFVGVDVGRKHDLTMIWVLEPVGDVLWTRQVHAVENTPLPDQQKILAEVLRSVKLGRCCVDQTGIGLGLFEYAQREFGASRIEGVTFTNKSKQALAVGIKESFEDRRVRIPADCRQVREGLHKVRKTTTGTGLIRFDAPRDDAGHADEFWALALALEAGSDPPGPVEAASTGRLAFAGRGLW